jgi:hypothetical protein
MPDTSETAALVAQIEALIRKANDCLRQQLEDVRRSTDNAHDQAGDAATRVPAPVTLQ